MKKPKEEKSTQVWRRHFGTDGIRGEANFDLTAELALKVGQAAGLVFKNGGDRKVLIGKDTRLSGYMIEQTLTGGFLSAGMNVDQTGPIPTPGVAALTRAMRMDLGVMISASHNPYADNGIKLFGPDGYKISDDKEHQIEAMINNPFLMGSLADRNSIGRAKRIDGAQDRYVEFVEGTFPKNLDLDGLRIVLDCANGAAYKVAPQALRELGAEVFTIGVEPDGYNINDECGSTHPESISRRVKGVRADIGIALDGDADRVVLCDEHGRLIDGDQVLALIAETWLEADMLAKKLIVGTVMSNLALEWHLRNLGIELVRTKVGDRNVLVGMQERGANLGGEQSGHIIMSDYTTTGDGLIAALQVLAVLKKLGQPVSTVAHRFDPLPQVMRNVEYRKGTKPLEHHRVKRLIREIEGRMGKNGRLVVRPSGTEPKIRIMAESQDRAQAATAVEAIAKLVEEVK
ncbi:MAG TPA: phosphoglucosamine mutase [Candidatus Paceibacterota bacterium]|nr:phosphoglucosamine mutase [Candidatus Paceibacterota bacterium]